MGSFICAISERDWQKSRELGIYGNKIGRLLRDGSYVEFNNNIKSSIIRDLISIKEGDIVFFHVVKTKSGLSSIHGVYEVTGYPYYDDEHKIWDDKNEIFPYRFLFKPHPKFTNLCNYDAKISVTNFYQLIEKRKIWSLATLENERNIEARSVRKIADKESEEIIRLLNRNFRHEKREKIVDFNPINSDNSKIHLENKLNYIGRYENSIKAFIMYCLAHKKEELSDYFGKVRDFMNEVFIAQTTRKCIDILVISETDDKKIFFITEVKTERCDKYSMMQILYYMDLFKQKKIFRNKKDIIVGCLIGKSFAQDIIDYAKIRNFQGVNGSLFLLKYVPSREGNSATFEKIVDWKANNNSMNLFNFKNVIL